MPPKKQWAVNMKDILDKMDEILAELEQINMHTITKDIYVKFNINSFIQSIPQLYDEAFCNTISLYLNPQLSCEKAFDHLFNKKANRHENQ